MKTLKPTDQAALAREVMNQSMKVLSTYQVNLTTVLNIVRNEELMEMIKH